MIVILLLFIAFKQSHQQPPCAYQCYLNMVNHVAPVEVNGVVSLTIFSTRQFQHSNKYLNTLEQFQNVCWIYRDYAYNCIKKCPRNRITRRIVLKFFRALHQYCIKEYDTIIQNWSCQQRTRKFRKMCDSECAYTCDRTCLFYCLRPVLRRVCSNDSLARLLLKVREVRSLNHASHRPPICGGKVVSSNRKSSRVN